MRFSSCRGVVEDMMMAGGGAGQRWTRVLGQDRGGLCGRSKTTCDAPHSEEPMQLVFSSNYQCPQNV